MERLASSSRCGRGEWGIGHGTSLVSGHFARLDYRFSVAVRRSDFGSSEKRHIWLCISGLWIASASGSIRTPDLFEADRSIFQDPQRALTLVPLLPQSSRPVRLTPCTDAHQRSGQG
jgi:hypothetical protein